MGDRSNVVVKDGEDRVFLYSHWGGPSVATALQRALGRAKDRWDDAPYLARVIFQEMIGGDKGTTGFGISSRLCDNEYPIIVANSGERTVEVYAEVEGGLSEKPIRSKTMEEFCAILDAPKWMVGE